jgi:hypothetical protein
MFENVIAPHPASVKSNKHQCDHVEDRFTLTGTLKKHHASFSIMFLNIFMNKVECLAKCVQCI